LIEQKILCLTEILYRMHLFWWSFTKRKKEDLFIFRTEDDSIFRTSSIWNLT